MYKRFLRKLSPIGRSSAAFFKKHWRQIVYYAGVMVLLGAVAYAAELYRQKPNREEMILPAVEIAQAEEKMQLLLPEGEKIRNFSAKPVWNDILAQWECHLGLDYAVPDNQVTALADGKIIDIGANAERGGYAEIQHGEMILRYCSMAPLEGLTIGSHIEAGEELGMADNSMCAESYMQEHLHLEAVVKGEFADISVLLEE